MLNNIQDTQDNCVMTLRDIVDFINQKRGVKKGDKGFKQHSQALLTIQKLASEAPNFGSAKKVCLSNYDKNGNRKEDITSLSFTAKQAIAVGAKLDNGLLMDVIDKVEELEGKVKKPQQLSFNQMKINALTKISDQINALEDDTKALQAPQTTQTPEVIEAIAYIEEKGIQAKERVKRVYQVDSKYHHLKRTNVRDLKSKAPSEGTVTLEFYNNNDCILYDTNKNVTLKIATPPWTKNIGEWTYIKAHVKYIRTEKTGRLVLIEILERS